MLSRAKKEKHWPFAKTRSQAVARIVDHRLLPHSRLSSIGDWY